MIRSLLLASALVMAPAAAQESSKEAPAPAKPPERPATQRPSLNLKLDNPSSWATNAPADKTPPKDLPTLGGDAQSVAPSSISESRSFPKDTNPGK
ncbi:MAG: hypothetical protein QOD26_125 [Betaproteobacteria bacterium]|jgi:hypothetical protein|nr:hypothetical protein [Betaproteobacteria bacterium]